MRLSLEESEEQTRELALAHGRLVDQKAALNALADSFESTLEDIIGMIDSAAIEMEIAAQALSAISEVGRRVAQASQMSRRAVEDVRQTNETVIRLDNAALKIGEIVGFIKSVAEQTNLLSLNATIESARAGNIGRGFAVVAGEVKTLAIKTARATGEIAEQVAATQGFTGNAADAIQLIEKSIQSADEIAKSIANLVEQNAMATNNILARISRSDVNIDIRSHENDNLSAATEDISQAATQVFGSAYRLLSQSKQFESELRTFLRTFRSM